MNLRHYIKQAGFETVDEGYYARVARWRDWYGGKVRGFHDYTIFSSGKRIRRERATLNMAKQGCEYWANLLWNSKCAVNLDSAEDDRLVNGILLENDFTRQANVLVERAWALGSGAFVAYAAHGGTRLDYVTAEYIFPLSWRNDEIESCAFAASYNQGAKRLMYVMFHLRQEDGRYRIMNHFFEVRGEGEEIVPIETPEGVEEEYMAGAARFAIIKPNIANNAADVPMGISVYANCVDALKSIDLAYDGAKSAMEIGRPRIGVSTNMLQVDRHDGTVSEVFDANDIAVYSLGTGGAEEGVTVKDLTTPYRATEFEQSLQAQLMIYAQCIGLGENAFKWDRAAGDVAKTATEVIYSNSTMVRTMEKHQDGLRSAIERLVRAVLDINGRDVSQGVHIAFDDSAARDRGREALEAWQWVVAGRYPFWRYLVDFKGYDEAEAKEIEAEARQAGPEEPGVRGWGEE